MVNEITDSSLRFSEGIIINELAAWMDGGTVTFYCETLENKGIEIELIQRVNLQRSGSDKFPGALYLNNILVGLRSSLEKDILIGLKKAKFKEEINITDLDKKILKEVIEYLESDELIEISKKAGRIKK